MLMILEQIRNCQKHLTFNGARAMDFLEPFVAVLVILQESIKLLPKNGKLMAFTAIVPTLLSSLFFLIFYFSFKSILRDMLARVSFVPVFSSNSSDFATILPGLGEDYTDVLVVEVLFILAYSVISLYFTIATILLSASSYKGRTISYKDLALLTIRAWRRQYTTRFYTSLLVLGYIVFVLLAASPVLTFPSSSMDHVSSSAILVGIAACIWYMYLSVTWILGILISVVEENCYGIEALGRAGRLLEGKRIQGFILNIMFNLLLAVVVFGGFGIIRGHKWLADGLIFGLFIVIFSCLLRFLFFVGFTVLYFQCKKNHGEEIELQGGIQYSKISTTPPIDDIL